MGPHPGRKKLIVRSFEPKPSRYAEKVAKVADAPPLSPPPAARSPSRSRSACLVLAWTANPL
jgi:hypothetical protein